MTLSLPNYNNAQSVGSFLTEIAKASEANNDPMFDFQEMIGEMLRDDRILEKVKIHAVVTLTDLVAKNPVEANPNAVRRLAKFFIHGPKDNCFHEYKPDKVMSSAYGALICYADEKAELTNDEREIFSRAVKTATGKYGVTPTRAKKLQEKLSAVPA